MTSNKWVSLELKVRPLARRSSRATMASVERGREMAVLSELFSDKRSSRRIGLYSTNKILLAITCEASFTHTTSKSYKSLPALHSKKRAGCLHYTKILQPIVDSLHLLVSRHNCIETFSRVSILVSRHSIINPKQDHIWAMQRTYPRIKHFVRFPKTIVYRFILHQIFITKSFLITPMLRCHGI